MHDYEPFTQGYTAEEAAAEQEEFLEEHGCRTCDNWNTDNGDRRRCEICTGVIKVERRTDK